MKRPLFQRLFPVPSYLARPAAGLDLSDRSLKFVRLKETSSGLGLAAYGERALPLDVVQDGNIKNKPALTKILKSVRAEWQLDNVIVALPEEQAFIVRIDLPQIAPTEWRESIELQLEEYIPIKASETVFDYEPIRGVKGNNSVLVSALPQTLVRDYEEVLMPDGNRPTPF